MKESPLVRVIVVTSFTFNAAQGLPEAASQFPFTIRRSSATKSPPKLPFVPPEMPVKSIVNVATYAATPEAITKTPAVIKFFKFFISIFNPVTLTT